MNNYFGVMDYFYPDQGCVRTLVMAGVFTGEELFRVNNILKKEGVL